MPSVIYVPNSAGSLPGFVFTGGMKPFLSINYDFLKNKIYHTF